MAAKKMFPPREVGNPLGKAYDEVKLGISFRILGGQIVMQFFGPCRMGSDERCSKACGDAYREGQRARPPERRSEVSSATTWIGSTRPQPGPECPDLSRLKPTESPCRCVHPEGTLPTVVKWHPHKSPHTALFSLGLSEELPL